MLNLKHELLYVLDCLFRRVFKLNKQGLDSTALKIATGKRGHSKWQFDVDIRINGINDFFLLVYANNLQRLLREFELLTEAILNICNCLLTAHLLFLMLENLPNTVEGVATFLASFAALDH